jgi:isoleucyl-tRNA synthetase
MFGFHRADEVRRQFLLPLWNVYSFLVTYANIDGWKPNLEMETAYSLLDRWVISRLNEVIEEVTARLERFEPDAAANAVNRFLDDLSNWYLRRSRRRFWVKSGESENTDADKHAAYSTLYQVLVSLSKLLAPFAPFISEVIYQNLARSIDPEGPESVHHCLWPKGLEEFADRELVEEMALVLRLVSLGHAARNKANRKLRQPLAESAFFVGSKREAEVVMRYTDLIRDELNVKEVRMLDAVSEAAAFRIKPLPKQLGQKYSSRFPEVRRAILDMESEKVNEVAEELLGGGSFTIDLEDEQVTILPEEVEVHIDAHEGYSAAAEGAYVAAIVVDLTETLELEGLAREFVRRVQDLRKQAGLEVDDRVDIQYKSSARLAKAITAHRDYILGETLAKSLDPAGEPEGSEVAEHSFDEEELRLAVRKSDAS